MNATRTILISILLAATVTASAQDAAPPRFFIERIEVRNHQRVSPQIIIAESLLRAGNEYSEDELKDANARLTRLPFLLTAEFSLERGSERGQHILVITINETRGFFFRLDLRPVFREEEHFESGPTHVSLESPTALDQSGSDLALGWRWFLGRRGALHLGLVGRRDNRDYTNDNGGFTVGWTQYDVFGTRAFATLNIKSNLGDPTPQLVVGVPLSLNQTLTFDYDETRYENERVFAGGIAETDVDTQRLITLRWQYNNTNHPFLPTRGTILYVTPVAVWQDDTSRDFSDLGTTPRRVVAHSRAFGIDVGASRYWELSERNSVSIGGELGTANVDADFDGRDQSYTSTHAVLQAGFSRSLWSREQMQRGGDSRLEVTVGALQRWRPEERFRDDDRIELAVGWVRRSSWGLLRLGAGVAW